MKVPLVGRKVIFMKKDLTAEEKLYATRKKEIHDALYYGQRGYWLRDVILSLVENNIKNSDDIHLVSYTMEKELQRFITKGMYRILDDAKMNGKLNDVEMLFKRVETYAFVALFNTIRDTGIFPYDGDPKEYSKYCAELYKAKRYHSQGAVL